MRYCFWSPLFLFSFLCYVFTDGIAFVDLTERLFPLLEKEKVRTAGGYGWYDVCIHFQPEGHPSQWLLSSHGKKGSSSSISPLHAPISLPLRPLSLLSSLLYPPPCSANTAGIPPVTNAHHVAGPKRERRDWGSSPAFLVRYFSGRKNDRFVSEKSFATFGWHSGILSPLILPLFPPPPPPLTWPTRRDSPRMCSAHFFRQICLLRSQRWSGIRWRFSISIAVKFRVLIPVFCFLFASVVSVYSFSSSCRRVELPSSFHTLWTKFDSQQPFPSPFCSWYSAVIFHLLFLSRCFSSLFYPLYWFLLLLYFLYSGQLSSLIHLYLSPPNELTTLTLLTFSSLTSLKKLFCFSSFGIVRDHLSALCILFAFLRPSTDFSFYTVNHNRINYLPPQIFSFNNKLTHLDLSANCLTTLPVSLAYLTTLAGFFFKSIVVIFSFSLSLFSSPALSLFCPSHPFLFFQSWTFKRMCLNMKQWTTGPHFLPLFSAPFSSTFTIAITHRTSLFRRESQKCFILCW